MMDVYLANWHEHGINWIRCWITLASSFAALQYIREQAGKQFDPIIVDTFVKMNIGFLILTRLSLRDSNSNIPQLNSPSLDILRTDDDVSRM